MIMMTIMMINTAQCRWGWKTPPSNVSQSSIDMQIWPSTLPSTLSNLLLLIIYNWFSMDSTYQQEKLVLRSFGMIVAIKLIKLNRLMGLDIGIWKSMGLIRIWKWWLSGSNLSCWVSWGIGRILAYSWALSPSYS